MILAGKRSQTQSTCRASPRPDARRVHAWRCVCCVFVPTCPPVDEAPTGRAAKQLGHQLPAAADAIGTRCRSGGRHPPGLSELPPAPSVQPVSSRGRRSTGGPLFCTRQQADPTGPPPGTVSASLSQGQTSPPGVSLPLPLKAAGGSPLWGLTEHPCHWLGVQPSEHAARAPASQMRRGGVGPRLRGTLATLRVALWNVGVACGGCG